MDDQLWISRKESGAPMAELIKPVNQRESWNKPRGGGLWTSTLDAQGSGWMRWCMGNSFADPRDEPRFTFWRLRPREDARVYEIDTPLDLVRLVEEFPGDGLTFLGGREEKVPNWSAVLEAYDGIHLTALGEASTRWECPPGIKDLYGWDCESTVWGRWVFEDVEVIDGAPLIAAAEAADEYLVAD